MSTRERAHFLLDMLSEQQVEAFLTLFGALGTIEEEEPDEIDLEMIRNKDIDNDERMSFEDFVRKTGFDPDEL